MTQLRFYGYSVEGVESLMEPVFGVLSGSPPAKATSTRTFSPTQLMEWAGAAGLKDMRVDTSLFVRHGGMHGISTWDQLMAFRTRPWAPSVEEALERCLTPPERDRVTRVLRPAVEANQTVARFEAWAFLTATA